MGIAVNMAAFCDIIVIWIAVFTHSIHIISLNNRHILTQMVQY
jgi:hypothetical protein